MPPWSTATQVTDERGLKLTTAAKAPPVGLENTGVINSLRLSQKF